LYAQVTVQRGDATTTVLWTRSPSPAQVKVPARSSRAILADAFGDKRTITPQDGVYTIDLPACTQPFCVTGGAPRLLVEGAPAAPIDPATARPSQPANQPTDQPIPRSGTQAASQPTNPAEPDASSQLTIQPSAQPTLEPTHNTSILTATPTPTATSSPLSTPTLTLTLTPPPTLSASNTDALLITLGIMLGALFIGFVLVRASSPRPNDQS